MTEDDVVRYALSLDGANVRYPYGKTPLVLSTADIHEFGEVYEGTEPLHIVLKCDPDRAEALRARYPDAVKPGYRCNKKYWNSVFVNGTVPDEELKQMILDSYTLAQKLSKKKKKAEAAPVIEPISYTEDF